LPSIRRFANICRAAPFAGLASSDRSNKGRAWMPPPCWTSCSACLYRFSETCLRALGLFQFMAPRWRPPRSPPEPQPARRRPGVHGRGRSRASSQCRVQRQWVWRRCRRRSIGSGQLRDGARRRDRHRSRRDCSGHDFGRGPQQCRRQARRADGRSRHYSTRSRRCARCRKAPAPSGAAVLAGDAAEGSPTGLAGAAATASGGTGSLLPLITSQVKAAAARKANAPTAMGTTKRGPLGRTACTWHRRRVLRCSRALSMLEILQRLVDQNS